jgi:excisionase family DNA binding protein
MEIIQVTKEELERTIRKVLCEILPTLNSKNEDELLTRRDACKYLGVTYPTLNAWEKKNLIKPTRLGNRVYFKKSDLLK